MGREEPVFMDWKTYLTLSGSQNYSKQPIHSVQSLSKLQLLWQKFKSHPQIHMEFQESLNSQNNSENEEKQM
jgi:hypothetical protein